MASGGGNDLRDIYDKYSRFGKTEAQLKEKEIRIESKNIQKLMKDTRVIDTKYPTQLLDIDINRVLGKLTTAGTYVKGWSVLVQIVFNFIFFLIVAFQSILAKHLNFKVLNN